jgi:hypothetical protein
MIYLLKKKDIWGTKKFLRYFVNSDNAYTLIFFSLFLYTIKLNEICVIISDISWMFSEIYYSMLKEDKLYTR